MDSIFIQGKAMVVWIVEDWMSVSEDMGVTCVGFFVCNIVGEIPMSESSLWYLRWTVCVRVYIVMYRMEIF